MGNPSIHLARQTELTLDKIIVFKNAQSMKYNSQINSVKYIRSYFKFYLTKISNGNFCSLDLDFSLWLHWSLVSFHVHKLEVVRDVVDSQEHVTAKFALEQWPALNLNSSLIFDCRFWKVEKK